MANLTPTIEEIVATIISILLAVMTSLCAFALLSPSSIKKSRNSAPNLILCATVGVMLPVSAGFLISSSFLFDVSLYTNSLTGESPLCTIQGILITSFGQVALFLLFSYVRLLYELVVLEKPASEVAAKQKRYIAISVSTGIILQIILPFAFPFKNRDDPNEQLVFGPQGPWCSTKNLVYLTVSFYVPTTITSLLTILWAFMIVKHVFNTSNRVKKHKNGGGGIGGAVSSSKSDAKFRAFYIRITIFSIIYAFATIGAGVKRLIEILSIDEFDPKYLDVANNDRTIGISVLLPLLGLIEMFVIASTPLVTKFYASKFHIGSSESSTDVRPVRNTNLGGSALNLTNRSSFATPFNQGKNPSPAISSDLTLSSYAAPAPLELLQPLKEESRPNSMRSPVVSGEFSKLSEKNQQEQQDKDEAMQQHQVLENENLVVLQPKTSF